MKISFFLTVATAVAVNGDPFRKLFIREREPSNNPLSLLRAAHRRDDPEARRPKQKSKKKLSSVSKTNSEVAASDNLFINEELSASFLRALQGEGSMPSFVSENENQPTTTISPADFTSKQPPWPHDGSDISPDPNVLFGELDNGMRYMALSNAEPNDRLFLRLHVDVGTNVEQDDEYGIAHYFEHMAFRSSRNFPNLTLSSELQRLGVGVYSGGLNAYTSFQETVYYVTAPNLDNATLSPLFTWMRDVVDGVLLIPEELETERGVVVSEIQDLDSVEWRIELQRLHWMLPDHWLPRRIDAAGTEEVVLGLTRQQFLDFYSQWYNPRRITFTAVGDMSTSDMEDLIQTHFESVVDTGSRGQEPSYGSLPIGEGFRSNVFVDSEVTQEEINIYTIRPPESRPDTRVRRIERMELSLANSILSNRIQMLSQEEDTNIVWGGVGVSRWYGAFQMDWIYVQPREGQWHEAVATLEQELRRASLYGFTQAELDEVKANVLNSYEQSVLSKDTRQSGNLASSLTDSINGNYVFSTPEEDLQIAMLALESITLGVVHERFGTYWNTTDLALYLITTSLPDDQSREATAEQLENLYFASQRVEVSPPVEVESAVFGYTDFGPPGTVVSDTVISDIVVSDALQEDLELRQLVLSNNVRINLMETGFEDETIHVRARFGSGRLSQPENTTFLDDFTSYMVNYGGLGEHGWFELDRLLAGRTVGVDMSVSNGAFTLSGRTNPDDLELQLQLMAAYLSDPGFGEEAVRWYRGEVPSFMNDMLHTLDGAFDYQVFSWLRGDDSRFVAPTEEELLAFEAVNARDWLVPQLRDSYLEVSLVGDLNQPEAIRMLLETLGALPERANSPPVVSMEDRAIPTPVPPQTRVFTYETSVPVAATMVVWMIPSSIGEDISGSRLFSVLSSIFNDRIFLTIREEMGGAYSPRARRTQSDNFEYGFFYGYVEGTTEEMDVLGDAIVSIAEGITGAEPITEDELDRAIQPLMTRIEESLRTNRYWLRSVVDESQAKPYTLDWARNREQFYGSITLEEINALAARYLTPDNALRISILPVNLTDSSSI